LAEHARYGISIIQDGRHQYANPSYVVLGGYSLDELKKKPFSKLISPQVIAGEFTDATRHGPDAPRAYSSNGYENRR
jgi:PAS domain-containing protein